MEQDDFYELFYLNLKKELNDDNYLKRVEDLIGSNKLTKNNFMKLLEEVYYE